MIVLTLKYFSMPKVRDSWSLKLQNLCFGHYVQMKPPYPLREFNWLYLFTKKRWIWNVVAKFVSKVFRVHHRLAIWWVYAWIWSVVLLICVGLRASLSKIFICWLAIVCLTTTDKGHLTEFVEWKLYIRLHGLQTVTWFNKYWHDNNTLKRTYSNCLYLSYITCLAYHTVLIWRSFFSDLNSKHS